MLLRAGMDQIKLKFRWTVLPLAGACQVPVVNVICPKVLDIAEALMEGFEGLDIARESGSLGSQEGRLVVDRAKERDPAACLIWG